MKIKYIINWFYTPRDINGNVYSFFRIVDTRSGRILSGKDVPRSNLQEVLYYLNKENHKQNYWWSETPMTKRQFKYSSMDIPYIGCGGKEIAEAFNKMMKSRKKFKA